MVHSKLFCSDGTLGSGRRVGVGCSVHAVDGSAWVRVQAHLVVVGRRGAVLGLVLLQGSVQVVPAAVVDVEAAHVRLGLGADDIGDDLEVLAELADTWFKRDLIKWNKINYVGNVP